MFISPEQLSGLHKPGIFCILKISVVLYSHFRYDHMLPIYLPVGLERVFCCVINPNLPVSPTSGLGHYWSLSTAGTNAGRN
jgi:hypothetical protein